MFALALVFFPIALASAQDQPASTAPQQQSLDAGQLDQLVAPIALYPDPLLAQVLMASTYPLEVVQADRWAKANKSLKGDKLTAALEKQDWDASVKQLVSTPTVLAMMNDKLDWTQALGDAVLAQQADVMDAIQRLRAKAQANGKLETTKQQKVTVKQDQGSAPIIEIEPASPDVVYVPYYDPAVVYGDWPYPAYPPYYFPPPAGWVVGGAIATGVAWGAAYAIGREIWDDFDWRHGNIDIDIDRNVNIDADRNFNKWEHNSYHRRGVAYNNADVKNKFNKANINASDRKLDYRGRSGEQVLKPGNKPGGGGLKPGGDNRPDLGGNGERPGGRPDIGQIEKGLKERPGKAANLPAQKPDLGKAKPKGDGGPLAGLSLRAKARWRERLRYWRRAQGERLCQAWAGEPRQSRPSGFQTAERGRFQVVQRRRRWRPPEHGRRCARWRSCLPRRRRTRWRRRSRRRRGAAFRHPPQA